MERPQCLPGYKEMEFLVPAGPWGFSRGGRGLQGPFSFYGLEAAFLNSDLATPSLDQHCHANSLNSNPHSKRHSLGGVQSKTPWLCHCHPLTQKVFRDVLLTPSTMYPLLRTVRVQGP